MPSVSASAIKAGEAYVKFGLDDLAFQTGLKRMAARMASVGQAVNRVNNQVLLGASGAAAGMAPVVEKFIQFDDVMQAVRARTKASATDFATLRDLAVDLGKSTGTSAVEVGKVMDTIATAGFTSVPQIKLMTAAVLDLAKATGSTAADAAGTLTATIGQFGLEAGHARGIVDALTVAANESDTTVTGLAESLKYSGTTLNDLNMTLPETLALFGALGNAGIKGSQAGTALQRLSILAASGAKDLKALFDVDAADAAGNMRPLLDILEDVQKSLDGLGNTEKAAKLNQFFGLLGITGASQLGKAGFAARKLQKAIEDGAGEAARVAGEMESGAGGAWRKLKGTAEGAAIAIGGALAGALGQVGDVLGGVLGAAAKWVDANQETVKAVLATAGSLLALAAAVKVAGIVIAAASSPLVILGGLFAVVFGDGITGAEDLRDVLIGVAAAAGTAAIAISAVAAVIGLVTSPVGIVAAALAGLTYAFVKFTDVGRQWANGLLDLFRNIGATFRETFGGVVAAMKKGDLQLAWDIILKGMNVAWLQFVEHLRAGWNNFANYFRDAFADAITSIQRVAIRFAATLQTAFLDAIIGVLDQANRAAARITDALTSDATKKREFELRMEERVKADPLGKQLYEDIFRENKTIEKSAGLKRAAKEAGADGLADLYDRDMKAAQTRVADLQAHLKNLEAKYETVVKAGDKFIDTSPFQAARDDIRSGAESRVKKVQELDTAEREARNKGQADRLDAIKKEREQLQAELRALITEANREVAPMPREAGAQQGGAMALPGRAQQQMQAPVAERFGDAVRGLYQSADFQGSLGIGPASEMAKQQLKAMTDVGTKLDDLKGLMGRAVDELKDINRFA